MSPGNRSNPQDQKTSQENTSHHVKPGRLGKRRGQLNRRIRSGRLMVGFLAARRTSAGGRVPVPARDNYLAIWSPSGIDLCATETRPSAQYDASPSPSP